MGLRVEYWDRRWCQEFSGIDAGVRSFLGSTLVSGVFVICLRACVCVYVFMCMCVMCRYLCAGVCVYVCVCLRACVCVQVFVCMGLCVFVCVPVYFYVCSVGK